MEDHTLSRTYRYSADDARNAPKHSGRNRLERPFRCAQCKAMVGPVPYGGSHRNHCPYCLYSRHVDGRVPGDRASTCGGRMAPIGTFSRRNGEHVVVHHCLSCRFERYNRIAADDDFDLVVSLPVVDCRPRRKPAPVSTEELSA
ncbi:MAG TPA: RNHCP domain-containing protein [Chloroflexota bacterium]|nr:RNHCP domain-containing protein [Chloroflexota bacterium]